MPVLYHTLLTAHVIVSTAVLVLFWVPIITPKGALNHRRFGHYYHHFMLVSLLTGASMAMMLIFTPLEVRPELFRQSANISAELAQLQRFALFLVHLFILMYCNLMMGRWSLVAKQNRYSMRLPSRLIPAGLLMLSSLIIGAIGIQHTHILMMIFAPLGIMTVISQLRFTFAKQVSDRAWLVEHLSGYIGSGIGAYTAFFAFGGRTLFASSGAWQFLFWILPGVIGAIAIQIESRKVMNINSIKE